MEVCCVCCVLSGRGLCDELITRPEGSCRVWCVVVCDLETSRMRTLRPTGGGGLLRTKNNNVWWTVQIWSFSLNSFLHTIFVSLGFKDFFLFTLFADAVLEPEFHAGRSNVHNHTSVSLNLHGVWAQNSTVGVTQLHGLSVRCGPRCGTRCYRRPRIPHDWLSPSKAILFQHRSLSAERTSWTNKSSVGWGTALQARRSRVRFPIVSLEFFFDKIFPATLWL